jgi:sphingosine kinase
MDTKANSLPTDLVIRRPVHSETLQYKGRLFSVIIVQDDNPRIEWTREGERGQLHVVPFKRIVGAKMSDKAPATFDVHWIPESSESDREGMVKQATWTVPAGHGTAVWLCNAIDCLVRGVSPEKSEPKRRIHAFINPFSGVAGGSLEIWNQVKALFSIASIEVEEVITTHQGHAEEVCKTLDLNLTKEGIVVVSGDGLFHEVVNGLLHREDWEQAAKIPLGIIPAGSGNGLARSLQAWNPFRAALAIIKGHQQPLDTWSVIANNDRRFAVLSMEWGTVASIDFDSEAVRFMGGARFHLWSFLKLINRQRYSAVLSWLPGQEDPEFAPKFSEMQAAMWQEHILRISENSKNQQDATEAKPTTNDDSEIFSDPQAAPSTPSDSGSVISSISSPASSEKSHSAASSSPNTDGIASPITTSSSSPNLDRPSSSPIPASSLLLSREALEEAAAAAAADEDSPSTSPSTTPIGTPRGALAPPLSAAELDLTSLPGPPLVHLIERDHKEGWQTVSGDWMIILGLNTTHMAHNVHAAPRASISDGLIDVLTISKTSRRTLLRMILAMEEGTHMDDPDLAYHKAKAFILKPSRTDDKHMLHGVDGEKVICDGLMVEVHPRLLNVFCDLDDLTNAALKNPHSLLSKELHKLSTELQKN